MSNFIFLYYLLSLHSSIIFKSKIDYIYYVSVIQYESKLFISQSYCPLLALPFDLPKKGLVLTRLGKPWKENALIKRIQRSCVAVKCHKIQIHTLRHAHATYSLAVGDNVYDIMSRCGWKSFAIVERYVESARQYNIKSYLPKWRG